MSNRFTLTFTAQLQHIDVMGHVNNAVWVQWMEALATAHWEAVAPAEHQALYAWVVTRHEIDYRGNVTQGQGVTARTGRRALSGMRAALAPSRMPPRAAMICCNFPSAML